MRVLLALLALLAAGPTAGCSLFVTGEDAEPAPDSSIGGTADGNPATIDSGFSGTMIGPCELGTGPTSNLNLAVSAGWIDVNVCGASGSFCTDSLSAPCVCAPGSQCVIPFPAGSQVWLESDICSRWDGPTGGRTSEMFDVIIGETSTLVIAGSAFCE